MHSREFLSPPLPPGPGGPPRRPHLGEKRVQNPGIVAPELEPYVGSKSIPKHLCTSTNDPKPCQHPPNTEPKPVHKFQIATPSHIIMCYCFPRLRLRIWCSGSVLRLTWLHDFRRGFGKPMRSWPKRARGTSTLRSNTGLAKTQCQAEINQYIDVYILHKGINIPEGRSQCIQAQPPATNVSAPAMRRIIWKKSPQASMTEARS